MPLLRSSQETGRQQAAETGRQCAQTADRSRQFKTSHYKRQIKINDKSRQIKTVKEDKIDQDKARQLRTCRHQAANNRDRQTVCAGSRQTGNRQQTAVCKSQPRRGTARPGGSSAVPLLRSIRHQETGRQQAAGSRDRQTVCADGRQIKTVQDITFQKTN